MPLAPRYLKLLLLACALLPLAVIGRLSADEGEHGREGGKRGDHVSLEDMMERVHKGRRSPLSKTKAELAANMPDWDVIEKQLSQFEKMSKALAGSRKQEVKDAASGYTSAVDDLIAAAKKRDAAAATTAIKALQESCTDCHYKGGPGGRLERD